jgi:hypothetical protein
MNKTQKSRHDKETSKKLVWNRQADTKTLSKNQELRQRYKETSGEGMDAADVERAKLLIARDQRKQEKKTKKNKKTEGAPTETSAADPTKSSETTKEKVVGTSTPAKAQEEKAVKANDSSKATSSTTTNTKGKKKSSEAQAKRDQNKALRKLYLETDGKGMREDQIERAKLLIARDEKKKERRAAQKEQAMENEKQ